MVSAAKERMIPIRIGVNAGSLDIKWGAIYGADKVHEAMVASALEHVKILEDLGIRIEVHHHEVASGGQLEIDMRYDSLVNMADKVLIYKYVARNLAAIYTNLP